MFFWKNFFFILITAQALQAFAASEVSIKDMRWVPIKMYQNKPPITYKKELRTTSEKIEFDPGTSEDFFSHSLSGIANVGFSAPKGNTKQKLEVKISWIETEIELNSYGLRCKILKPGILIQVDKPVYLASISLRLRDIVPKGYDQVRIATLVGEKKKYRFYVLANTTLRHGWVTALTRISPFRKNAVRYSGNYETLAIVLACK